MLKCKKCLYVTKMGGCYACGYCLFTGKMRKCDPEDCDKFEEMDKEKRKEIDGSASKICASYSDEHIKYISENSKKGREL